MTKSLFSDDEKRVDIVAAKGEEIRNDSKKARPVIPKDLVKISKIAFRLRDLSFSGGG